MENNKGYLIDTHIFIWWMEKSDKLPREFYDFLNNRHNIVYLSVVSAWEIILKKRRKKLKLSFDIKAGIEKSGFILLSINLDHVLGVDALPVFHSDPFDRLLISQSKKEKLTLITLDKKMRSYDVSLKMV